MFTIFSDSKAELVQSCAMSACLSVADSSGEEARIGTAMHAFQEVLGNTGSYKAAWRALPAICEGQNVSLPLVTWRLKKFAWRPPAGALCEVALALRTDGTVVRVTGGHGHYPDLPEDVFGPGQIDLIWSEPEPLVWKEGDDHPTCPEGSILFVVDYKSGGATTPIARNGQLRRSAFKAAVWTHAEQVMPSVLYMTEGEGDWDAPPKPWGQDTLDEIWAEIVATQNAVDDMMERKRAGEPVEYREGSHCQYCPSARFCPAQTASLLGMIGSVPTGNEEAPISEEQWRSIAAIEAALTRTAAAVKDALRKHVVASGKAPIQISEHVAWGVVPVEKKRYVVERALPILKSAIGKHVNAALSLSAESIRRAVEVAQKAGVVSDGDQALRVMWAKLSEEASETYIEEHFKTHKTGLEITGKKKKAKKGSQDGDGA